MNIEFAVWTLRGLTNQLFPIATVFFLSRTSNTAEIAYLAPIFIACGVANLLRSGAITASTSDRPIRSSLTTEVLYTILSTTPFLLITPAPSQDVLLFNSAIVLASSVSGAFAARLERAKGLHQLGISDLASLIFALLIFLAFMDLSPRNLGAALALRECVFLLLMIVRTRGIPRTCNQKQSITTYAKENLGQTIFWISGPWKDYLITNTAVALYTGIAYGTYYAVQLYWSLPSLFLGLMLRPALKSFQNGHITTNSIRKHIFWMMLISISGLALLQWLVRMTPPSPAYLVMSALLPAATSPFVVPAMMKAVKANKSKDIIIQNLLWAIAGCTTLFTMQHEGLAGLATTIAITNLASAYIIVKHPC